MVSSGYEDTKSAYLPVLGHQQTEVSGGMELKHLAIKAGDHRIARDVAVDHTGPLGARALLVVFAAIGTLQLKSGTADAGEVADICHRADVANFVAAILPGADACVTDALIACSTKAFVTVACTGGLDSRGKSGYREGCWAPSHPRCEGCLGHKQGSQKNEGYSSPSSASHSYTAAIQAAKNTCCHADTAT